MDWRRGTIARLFRTEGARYEKGSALELIAAETRATEDKTARLKALRLAREAADVVVVAPSPVPAPRSRKRKTA